MTRDQPEMKLRPIGVVRNGIPQQPVRQEWKDIVSEIVIDPSLADALDNLDEFSHIIVLFWTYRSGKENTPHKIHPRDKPGLPLMGLFATRSPDRPNPIAITIVKLLGRTGNILKVKGLDAFDGTRVIDIKPYIPDNDSVDNARVPAWVTS
jgi:tRNA-Thr(GGU) m(6)t(6)A37 methyltransferase TsaA